MAKRTGWDVPPNTVTVTVTVTVDGKEYSGTYTVSSGVVIVQSMYGENRTHGGGKAK